MSRTNWICWFVILTEAFLNSPLVWAVQVASILHLWCFAAQRIYTGSNVLVILVWRQLCKLPLVSVIIIVIHPVINDGFYLREVCTFWQIYLIFHVTEETFLRHIIPTISFTQHRLTKLRVLDELDKSITGIVASLVAVDQCFSVQGHAVLLYKRSYGFQNKVYFQRFA